MRIIVLFLMLSAGLGTHPALSAVLRQVTDERNVGFGAASLDDAGTWAFAVTNADLGGANPSGLPQAGRWSISTGSGSILTSFPDGVDVGRFAASDGGQWLLLASTSDPLGTNPAKETQLFLYRTDGGEIRQLTNAAPGEPTPEFSALSGSANRVVFSSSADLTGQNPSRQPQLFVVNGDGTGLLQLTSNTGAAGYEPSISDDGERIGFVHAGNPTGGNTDLSPELFAILANGSGLRQLTSTAGLLGGVFEPMVSGDGSKIVFASAENIAGLNTSGVSQVWSVNWDGTNRRRLTANTTGNSGSASEPSVADDGVWVAFVQSRVTTGNPDGSAEIWKVKTDATGEAQLTNTSGGGHRLPAISGDASRIVFGAGGPIGALNTDGGPALVAVDSSGGSLTLLLEGVDIAVSQPDLTADGAAAFFVGTTNALGTNPSRKEQIVRVNADGAALSQLTAFDDQGWLWHPAVTSGGEWVVFVSDGDPLGLNPSGDGELFAVRGNGTGLGQLTPDGSGWPGPRQGAPAIAASGAWVVFQADANYTGGNPDLSGELFRIRTDGTGVLQLTSDDDTLFKLPRLDAAGTWAVYQRGVGSTVQVFRVRTDGTGLEQLTNDATYNAYEPDISDAGDRIVFSSTGDPLGTNPEHNGEVFLLEPGTGVLRQLTSSTTGDSDRARISGNGAWVAFLSSAPFFGPNPTGGYEVYRVRVSDGHLERVSGLGARGVAASWRIRDLAVASADGSKIAFATSRDPADRNLDGSGEVFLADFDAMPGIRVAKGTPTVVTWDAEPQAIAYDLIRGNVAALSRDGGTVHLGTVACVENDSGDLDNVESEDPGQPAPGQVFFYLLRGSSGPLVGPGSYGQGSGGRERVATSGDCPG